MCERLLQIALVGVHIRLSDREDWFRKFGDGGRPFGRKHIVHFMKYVLNDIKWKATGESSTVPIIF